MTGRRLSRRQVVKGGATGIVSLAGGALLAGCSTTPAPPAAVGPTSAPAQAAPTTAAPAATTTPAAKYGGIYRHWTIGELPHRDPHQTTNPNLFNQGPGYVYNRLVLATAGPERKSLDEVVYAGDAAEKWDFPDDTTVIFKVRPNLKFQNIKPVNGRPLVAEDIRYSFQRQLELKINAGGIPASIERMEAVDPQTFKVTLKQPDADFIATLANVQNVIVPKETVDANGDLKEGPNIGGGAWIDESWQKDAVWTGARNPDYYQKGIPYVDKVQFFRFADATAKFQAFRTKQIDYFSVGATKKQLEDLKAQDPTLVTGQSRRPGGLIEVALVTTKKPFDDKRVRQAIHYAIDRQAALDTVFEGLGFLSAGVPMPSWDWYLPDAEIQQLHKRDVAKAKQLLAEAGFPNGQGLPEIEFYHLKFSDDWTAAAELAMAQLKEVGINGKIKVYPDPSNWAIQILNGGNKEVMAWHGPMNLTTASANFDLLSKYVGGGARNGAGLDDPTLNDMIRKQATLVRDPDGRKKLLQDIQRRIIDLAVYQNTGGASATAYAYWGYVKNVRAANQPTNEQDFVRWLWLDK
jgi:peptide/nickel transport system substrate-binding protein